MTRTQLLNALILKYNYSSYLEIGVHLTHLNFEHIQVYDKIGVDPDTTIEDSRVINTTSDEYFKDSSRTFDLIFIDGLHEEKQVTRDIENALECLNTGGLIVVDDLNPANEEMQQFPNPYNDTVTPWTGNVWKAWVRMRKKRHDLSMGVIKTDPAICRDYGIGIIDPRGTQRVLKTRKHLSYKNFDANRDEWLNMVTVDQFEQVLGFNFADMPTWTIPGEKAITGPMAPIEKPEVKLEKPAKVQAKPTAKPKKEKKPDVQKRSPILPSLADLPEHITGGEPKCLWVINILTIPERKESFARLKNQISGQITKYFLGDYVKVGHSFSRSADAGGPSIGEKRQQLLYESITREKPAFVSFLDDDDVIADDFIEKIASTLSANIKTDALLFNVDWRLDGKPYRTIFYEKGKGDHSNPGATESFRGPDHLTPIASRHYIGFMFPDTNNGEDAALRIYMSNKIKQTVKIDETLLTYNWKGSKE